MRYTEDAAVCWAPECGNVPAPSRGSRPSRYCSPRCRVRAVRRNGGTAPSEPYPPLQPDAATPIAAVADAGKAPAPTARKSPAKAPRRRTVKAPPEAPAGASDSAGAAPPEATVTQLHVAVTEDSTIPVTVTVHPMVAAYKVDLARMGKAETRQGHQIVAMAEKLVSSATSPAAAANLSKELERLMASLEASAPEAQASADPSVVIRERTIAKLRAVAGGA